MYLNMSCPNTLETKCVSTCIDQTPPMPARTENAFQHVLTKPLPCQLGHKIISTFVDQTPAMPRRTQNASQHVLTIPIPCQRRQYMHLKMCWPNPSNASEDTKFFSTCVDKTQPMTAWTLHVLTKQITCISSCADQADSKPARTQNASQIVLTNPTHGNKMYFKKDLVDHVSEDTRYIKMCSPNPSFASKVTKCI
jgi:hypothetical protein